MRILIVFPGLIPVYLYGGTQRVLWGLGKELAALGHEVSFLVKEGSTCDFAKIIPIDESKSIVEQISSDFDVVHFHFNPKGVETLKVPYLITMHGNRNDFTPFDKNTVFVSQNHAARFGSDSYVHNGLDWSEYKKAELKNKRSYFHFLGNAAWRVKNVKGAIDVIKKSKTERLHVLGGVRFNFKMGIRLTFSPKIRFFGMVGGQEKMELLNGSKGLVFPVKWHEPFGLAITESLYYGSPVFGTPYGSLPELVTKEVGFLSNQSDELANAILESNQYSRQKCHEYARDIFNSKVMALAYLKKYETVLSGEKLNKKPPKLIKLQDQKWLDWD